jgi:hypothetical protein
MINNNPSSGWQSFSTFLDQAYKGYEAQTGQAPGQPAQPGTMSTWQEQFQLGNPRTAFGMPLEDNSALPSENISPMQGFPQFEGQNENQQLHQRVLDRAQNPAQQVFDSIGQGQRYAQRRQAQRGRAFNQFKSYGTQNFREQ